MEWKERARERFSLAKDAKKWDLIYSPEVKNIDAINFKKRRDSAINFIVDSVEKNKIVLDLGCGAAPLLRKLCDYNFSNVLGIDYSQDMLLLAKENLKNYSQPVLLMRGECENIPLANESVDCIACLGVISYAQSIPAALKEIERVLVPGGTTIVTYRNYYNKFFMDPFGLLKFVFDDNEKKEIGRSLTRKEVLNAVKETDLFIIKENQIGFGALRINGKIVSDGNLAIKINFFLEKFLKVFNLSSVLRGGSDIHMIYLRKKYNEI